MAYTISFKRLGLQKMFSKLGINLPDYYSFPDLPDMLQEIESNIDQRYLEDLRQKKMTLTEGLRFIPGQSPVLVIDVQSLKQYPCLLAFLKFCSKAFLAYLRGLLNNYIKLLDFQLLLLKAEHFWFYNLKYKKVIDFLKVVDALKKKAESDWRQVVNEVMRSGSQKLQEKTKEIFGQNAPNINEDYFLTQLSWEYFKECKFASVAFDFLKGVYSDVNDSYEEWRYEILKFTNLYDELCIVIAWLQLKQLQLKSWVAAIDIVFQEEVR